MKRSLIASFAALSIIAAPAIAGAPAKTDTSTSKPTKPAKPAKAAKQVKKAAKSAPKSN